MGEALSSFSECQNQNCEAEFAPAIDKFLKLNKNEISGKGQEIYTLIYRSY